MQKLRKIAASLIAGAVKDIWDFGDPTADVEKYKEMLEYPPDETMGHLAFPCFKLSRDLRNAPPKIAAAIAEQISDDTFESIAAVGGYLNFKVSASALADILAEKMAECVKTDFKDIEFDFICYIPFTTSQKIQRKYNQSELLAEKLSKKLNIPLSNIMVKLFDTNSQHKMNLKYRAGNVFGVYDVKEKVDVTGKTILLVDDVRTTGATLNDCARILKIRGAEKVYCTVAVVAGAKPKNDNNESAKLK